MAIQADLKKKEKFQTNDLTAEGARKRTTNKTPNLQKEGNNIRAQINEINTKETEEINETKIWFLEKIKKIGNPLARITKKKRQRAQIKSEMKQCWG